QLELGEDARYVLLDRALGDNEPLGDAGVGSSLRHQRQDLALARGQAIARTAAPRQQLRHDLWVERRPAVGYAPKRIQEFAHVGHPILQQVADAAGVSRKQLGRVALLDV